MYPKSVAVIGGGISGLAAAQRLAETSEGIKITLFEASDRLGGVLRTTSQDGFLIEHSADNFIVSDELPWAGELCRQLGVELISTTAVHRGALILKGRNFYPVPDGLHLMSIRHMLPVLASPLLSLSGKLRVACEPFVPRKKTDHEESLTQFATRRLGREMFDRVIQPLVAGIYTADPDKLSVAAALPQFVQMERQHGSLTRAAARRAPSSADTDRGARYSLFRAPPRGMQSLIDALETRLANITVACGSPVTAVRRMNAGQWRISVAGQDDQQFDALIVATSAPAAAHLLSGFAPELAALVTGIEHVSTSVVCLGYRREQIAHPLPAFGCVIPAIEGRQVLAISFSSNKFPNRAPEGHVLLRVFVGGALQADLADLPDDELSSMVASELAELLGVSGPPVLEKIVRWPRTTPQYHLGHSAKVREIREHVRRLPTMQLAGNAYDGIGVPQCVRNGWRAADALLAAETPASTIANE